MKPKVRLAVLGSGKGSNFSAILGAVSAGCLPAEIVLVASDQPAAGILDLARHAGIPSAVVEEPQFRTRLSEANELRLAALLQEHRTDLVVLAGFLRVLKAPLLAAFPHRIVNIHPSLLPKFRGLEAWRQALAAGEKTTGCTVHYVDAGLDTGEIIARREVPVLPGDTPETLHARIQEAEHALYPEALARLCAEIA